MHEKSAAAARGTSVRRGGEAEEDVVKKSEEGKRNIPFGFKKGDTGRTSSLH